MWTSKKDYYEEIDKLNGFVKYMVLFNPDKTVTNTEFIAKFKHFNNIMEIQYTLSDQNAKAEFRGQMARLGIRQSKNLEREYKGIEFKEKDYSKKDILELTLDIREADRQKPVMAPNRHL